ncbi:MAG: hypothetical protein ACYCPT_07035 [Acidimicrobiales bacterium]
MQDTGKGRDTIDKFYTNGATVELCAKLAQMHLHPARDQMIIEPAAGNGAFIPAIKKLTDQYKFYDIAPEHDEIVQQDFLQLKLNKQVIFIGNPPFGRQSSAAIKFIKHCCTCADAVAFILPSSFKKTSLQRHFPDRYHNVITVDVPKNAFLLNGEPYDVPCVFQIWVREAVSRAPIIIVKPLNFTFVAKNENPDAAFRRVGANAGAFYTKNIEGRSEQSHYFLKFVNGDATKILQTPLIFDTNNTVGPRSISKQELIQKINETIV